MFAFVKGKINLRLCLHVVEKPSNSYIIFYRHAHI